MFEVLNEWNGEGVVALQASGKLIHAGYERFVPKLEGAIQKYGAIRCLIDITELGGIELRAGWDELRFDLKHATQVSRCGVVADRAWERWATAATDPIFRKADIRFFERSEFEQTAAWVREGLDPAPTTAGQGHLATPGPGPINGGPSAGISRRRPL
ncbi:MAG: STAS/SEC14 domain-containing protein [Deltaproteobacteria bacterium]|nr:STAS/SEC14 domain-containing protein [Deltaproteobacteria bacterium]